MFSISSISKRDKWIYIKSTDASDILDCEPFVELVKNIAKKWNDDVCEGNITSVGNMRYKIKNDPLDLVYQWDDLFGIVFEYTGEIEEIKTFIGDNYGIE